MEPEIMELLENENRKRAREMKLRRDRNAKVHGRDLKIRPLNKLSKKHKSKDWMAGE